ncbi:S9 family peptidase [Gordonia sp. HY002]|uniref:S9 family peptidase n=1 Tax=Gordonia zhenghanii TaxID=2911516 RepID=UPI001EF123A7|nr:S9 family peptidase [Gordonia zhenghanii]MCF8572107.1 S9 family peptidase [Gordonia zhenghanii]MCF8602981.1 S9 family peptidase [Gordonia zhenghanii]
MRIAFTRIAVVVLTASVAVAAAACSDSADEAPLESLKPTVPTMVVQGSADELVFRQITDTQTAALCGNGANIDYRVYDGADHRGVLEQSFDDVHAYVEGVRAGKEQADTCA